MSAVHVTSSNRNLYNHAKQVEYIMKVKTITIGDEHEDWLHDNSVSLSRFVQKCIDEKMDSAIVTPIQEDV